MATGCTLRWLKSRLFPRDLSYTHRPAESHQCARKPSQLGVPSAAGPCVKPRIHPSTLAKLVCAFNVGNRFNGQIVPPVREAGLGPHDAGVEGLIDLKLSASVYRFSSAFNQARIDPSCTAQNRRRISRIEITGFEEGFLGEVTMRGKEAWKIIDFPGKRWGALCRHTGCGGGGSADRRHLLFVMLQCGSAMLTESRLAGGLPSLEPLGASVSGLPRETVI